MSNKYLIVGLGNIGSEYAGTRHNIVFRIANALAKSVGAAWTTERYGDIARFRLKNKLVTLLKPSTYMNLSGNAVRYWKDKEDIEPSNILILVDDLAPPLGAIRIKGSGSDAGHNGLKSIAQMLSTQAYPRLRFGIGNDFARGAQIDFVLGHFSPEQESELTARVDIAVDAVKDFVLAGIGHAMCNFNNK